MTNEQNEIVRGVYLEEKVIVSYDNSLDEDEDFSDEEWGD